MKIKRQGNRCLLYKSLLIIGIILLSSPGKLFAWQQYERHQIVEMAKSHVGAPYRRGGDSPAGFDCSGFTSYIYRQAGVQLPRRSIEQHRQLNPIRVPQEGDLLFFRTEKNRVSHVAIYIGDFQFIHAPRGGKRVRIDDIRNPYWSRVYAGSRSYLL